MRTFTARVWSVLALASVAACGPSELRPRTVAPYAEEHSTLISGDYTYERPEVGSINVGGGACTATLVGPQLVVTAAHCIDYTSRDRVGTYGQFEVRTGPTDSRFFSITRIASYMRNPGEVIGPDDVALLELGEAVPASLATPAPIARAAPAPGSGATIYGYGCQARGGGGRFAKQKLSIRFGEETANLCPGDSGGPTITADGAVARTNSGYYGGPSGPDDFGLVHRHASAIEATAARWGRTLATSGMPAPPGDDPPAGEEPPPGDDPLPPSEEPLPEAPPGEEPPPGDDGGGCPIPEDDGGGCPIPEDDGGAGGECGTLDGAICLPGNIIQLCAEDGSLEIYFCPPGSECSPGDDSFGCELLFGF